MRGMGVIYLTTKNKGAIEPLFKNPCGKPQLYNIKPTRIYSSSDGSTNSPVWMLMFTLPYFSIIADCKAFKSPSNPWTAVQAVSTASSTRLRFFDALANWLSAARSSDNAVVSFSNSLFVSFLLMYLLLMHLYFLYILKK